MPIFNYEILDKWLKRWNGYYRSNPTVKQAFRAGYLMGRAEARRSFKDKIKRVQGDLERDMEKYARSEL